MTRAPGSPDGGIEHRAAGLVRSFDWTQTELGPYERWPERLKGYVAMVLAMPRPAVIFWGPRQIQIYNDGYSVIMGPRHPRYFGAPYQACWPETHPVIDPWMQRVLAGEVVELERALIVLTRYGFTEEAYFTFTLSPLLDDEDRVAGILQPVVEVTREVLAERRGRALRAIEAATSRACSVHDAMAALGAYPEDIPFALLYRRGADGTVVLVETCGLADQAPREATSESVVMRVFDTRAPHTCEVSAVLTGEPHVGTWAEPTRQAHVVPVCRGPQHPVLGTLVCGLSPRLSFDDAYRDLVHAIASDLASLFDAERAVAAERELAEQAAHARARAEAERQRLHSVFENAPVAIAIIAGPHYVVELANPRILEMWGRSSSDVCGKRVFEALPELEGQGLRELLDEVRATGTPFVGIELPVALRSGRDGALREAFYNFVYEPMKDETGAVESILGVGIDVTPSVRARHAAERLASELEVARREAEQARDQAQHASRAKDDFLAMLGHELRNPLAPIFTALELWRDRDPTGASARPRAVIERQARHLNVLVDDLLDISRITSGKVELQRQRVAIGDVLTKALETASPMLEQRRHQLHVDTIPALCVDGDPARLVQVFANLLTNAAKYTAPGGEIRVAARAERGDVAITIRDTGRGISADILPTIFDLFVQERQTLARSQGGLGIGLAIVKNLVALHGGHVEASSEGVGLGSTFVVRLPLARDDARATAAPSTAATPRPAGAAKRILIIDDNEDAATLLDDLLTTLGYECRTAHDGYRGLELARAERFDAALVDIGLPVMDGYEVARQLRASPATAGLQLIAITGYGQPSDRERAIDAGFDAHLVKPISIEPLSRLLR